MCHCDGQRNFLQCLFCRFDVQAYGGIREANQKIVPDRKEWEAEHYFHRRDWLFGWESIGIIKRGQSQSQDIVPGPNARSGQWLDWDSCFGSHQSSLVPGSCHPSKIREACLYSIALISRKAQAIEQYARNNNPWSEWRPNWRPRLQNLNVLPYLFRYSGSDISVLVKDASFEPLRFAQNATRFVSYQSGGK